MSLSSANKPPVVEQSADPHESLDENTRRYRLRIRQQEILAELGVLALKATPFRELLQHTARVTADGLEAEFCKVLEYKASEGRFLVVAGVGWGPEVVGVATVGADLESPAGFALQTGKPVISNHLENEERFRTPELLVLNGIRRAMNVILQGDGKPFGVLEVDSRSEGEFSEHDIAFLQGAANLLGMAIERQRMERDLRVALDRQRLLIKEVNHRVNNSLQLVASMLHLQAGTSDDGNLKGHLQQASHRIAAIARAHQRLYRSEDFERLDLGAYLGDVCEDICKAIPGCLVTVDAAPGILIATDQAVPLALLVNELITNAVKYAYAGSAGQALARHAFVRIARTSNDEIFVSVRDHGIGLPADFDLTKQRGLGMRLVSSFVTQLDARLEVHRRDPGAEFTLTFRPRAQ
jgi:two-component sensor histidine kinase